MVDLGNLWLPCLTSLPRVSRIRPLFQPTGQSPPPLSRAICRRCHIGCFLEAAVKIIEKSPRTANKNQFFWWRIPSLWFKRDISSSWWTGEAERKNMVRIKKWCRGFGRGDGNRKLHASMDFEAGLSGKHVGRGERGRTSDDELASSWGGERWLLFYIQKKRLGLVLLVLLLLLILLQLLILFV